jgi:flagellin
MQFQVGANMDQSEQMFVGTMTASALKLTNEQDSKQALSLGNPDEANKSIGVVDSALKVVNKQRADLGAYQNRFEYAQKGVDIAAENLQASESRIRDTDMAKNMVDFVKNQILVQSSTAMLSQANTQPQSVLKLLG